MKVSAEDFPHFPYKHNSFYPCKVTVISHLMGHEHNFLNDNLITHPTSIHLTPAYSVNLPPTNCLPLFQVEGSHILKTEAGSIGVSGKYF